MPSLADFDIEDQAKIKQVVGMKPDRSLLSFAKENNLRVTSGYSSGGHNTGSKHYQGDAQHPGAIDIDHRGITPEMLRNWVSQGIRVLDETSRPKGQRVWTGPHYHLEYGQGGQQTAAPAQSKPQPASIPSVVGQVGTVAPPDLTNVGHPFKTDNNGITTRTTEKSRDFGKEIAKAASGVDAGIKARQSATIDPSQFEAEDQTKIADVLASLQRPEPPPPPVEPKKPGFMEQVGQVAGQVGNYAKELGGQALQGIQTQYANATAPPKDLGDALYKTFVSQNPGVQIGAGALSESANFINGLTDLVGAGKPIPTGDLEQFTAQAPVLSTIGRAAPYLLGEGAALKAAERFAPVVAKLATANAATRSLSAGAVNAAEGYIVDPKEMGQQGRVTNAAAGFALGGLGQGLAEAFGKLLNLHPEVAAKVQAGEPLTPQETARAHAVITPEETAALTEAWRQRTVGETKPIQQPGVDHAQVMREMAPRGVEQVSDTGLVVPKAGEKPKVNMEMGPALPEGQRVELGQPSPIQAPPLKPPTVDLARSLEREFGILDRPQKVRTAAEIKADENGMLKNGLQYLSRHPEYQDTPGLDFLDSVGITATQAKDIGDGLNYRVRVGGETYIVPRSIGVGGLVQRIGLDRLTNTIKQRGGLNAVKSLIDDVTRSGEPVGDIDALNQYRQFAERGADTVDGDTRLMQQAAINAADDIRKIQAVTSLDDLDNVFTEAFNKTPNVAGRDQLHVALVDAYDETRARIEATIPRDPNALRTSKDIALEKAARPDYGNQPDVISHPRDVRAATPEPATPPRLLDASGREMGRPGETPRDLGQIEPPRPLLDAQGREMGRPTETVKNSEPIQAQVDPSTPDKVYTQGRSPDDVQRLTSALEKNNQVLTLIEAKKLLSDKQKAGLIDAASFQKQTDALNLFEEAGRGGVSFDATRREIQEGMGRISSELGKAEVKTRDSLAPFAITVKQRQPATEVGNLIKELGSSEAAQAKMRETAGKYGITPTTKSFGGARADAAKSNAIQIAKQIAEHPKGKLEFTDIYLNAHNYKTGGDRTLTDAPRSYPLRTIEQANVGTSKVEIPQGAVNTNKINEAHQNLSELAKDPSFTPEAQRLINDISRGKVTPSTRQQIRKLIESSPEQMAKFCKALGV